MTNVKIYPTLRKLLKNLKIEASFKHFPRSVLCLPHNSVIEDRLLSDINIKNKLHSRTSTLIQQKLE